MKALYLIVVLSAIIVICSATVRPTEQQLCQLGPLYTCQNVNVSLQCQSLNECMPKWKAYKVNQPVSNGFYCNFCNMLLTDVQGLLRNNHTQDTIVLAVNRLCSEIHHDAAKHFCTKFANTYLRTALNMLANDIQPLVVCRAVSACSEVALYPQNLTDFLRLHFRNQNLLRSLQPHRVNIYPGMEKLYMAPTPGECLDCKKFVLDVKRRLINNATQQQLEAIFDEAICNAMPPSLSRLCRDVVHLYVNQLTTMLDQQLDPQEVCALLGFCDASGLSIAKKLVRSLEHEAAKQNPNSLTAMQRQASGMSCELCKGVVSRARMLLDSPLAQEKIRELLVTEVCPLLSFMGTEKCHLLVDLYLSTFMRLLRTELDLMHICQSVRLCPADTSRITEVEQPRSLPPFLVKSPTSNGQGLRTEVIGGGELSSCELCRVLLLTVHKRQLPLSTTRAHLISALREVCVLFHDRVAHKCDQLVDQHGVKMAAFLVQQRHLNRELTADNTQCPLTGCQTRPPSDSLLFRSVASPSRTTPATSGTQNKALPCDMCKQAVKTIESYVRQNRTEDEMEQYLISWCHSMPQKYQDECVNLVKEYLPFVIEALVTEADPETICKELDLCTIAMDNRLLGHRSCTRGPAYWCSSLLKARRCKAVQHCQRSVWMGEKPPQKLRQ